MAKDRGERISVAAMSYRVFEATEYRIQFERKSRDVIIKVLDPRNQEIVALKVVETMHGWALVCNDLMFAYNAHHDHETRARSRLLSSK